MTTTKPAADDLTVINVPGHGAEDVLVDDEGCVYTGTEDGSVFKVRGDGNRIDHIGTTEGRPLGLELLPDGRILVCDASRGLLAMDPANGRCELLADSAQGRRLVFCNNAAVASTGEIYFTDSSAVHPIERWKADLVENTRSGRLLRRGTDGAIDVVIEQLAFANGVALSADETFVAVAETAARTVVRRWLSGPREGQSDHLVPDLPGYPDNMSRGSDGLIWVAIGSPKDQLIERLMRAPVPLRRAAGRLPESLQPKPRRTARVMAFDDAGGLVHDFSRDASRFHLATGVREHQRRVWLGSLLEPAIAFFDL